MRHKMIVESKFGHISTLVVTTPIVERIGVFTSRNVEECRSNAGCRDSWCIIRSLEFELCRTVIVIHEFNVIAARHGIPIVATSDPLTQEILICVTLVRQFRFAVIAGLQPFPKKEVAIDVVIGRLGLDTIATPRPFLPEQSPTASSSVDDFSSSAAFTSRLDDANLTRGPTDTRVRCGVRGTTFNFHDDPTAQRTGSCNRLLWLQAVPN